MFFAGTDYIESGGTFSANLKSDGAGKILCQAYATSGMVAGTPYRIDYSYTTSGSCWLQPVALNASHIGVIGIASTAIASGCMGWVTIRGPVYNAQGAATSFTGSMGHAVYWGGATGIGATASAYIGAVHQIGVLLEETSGSTTADIFLFGKLNAQSL